MKRVYKWTLFSVLIMLILTYSFIGLTKCFSKARDHITVGFVYVGDSCNTYTNNFIRAQNEIEQQFGEHVTLLPKYNVAEGEEEKALKELVDKNCDLIFSTSYGYGEITKKFAQAYPDIQFCMATCSNANMAPVLDNYHNYMGKIYQGRYICGVVAGMKMKELIDRGYLTEEQAKVGYVGAFPYAEVISGYTAFFLGIRSVVPTAEMTVVYTNSWGDFDLEKQMTYHLINQGCVIISQHSDTTGPALVCEEMSKEKMVFHVGYNKSMSDIAPTTSLVSCRIDWKPYMVKATEAVLKGKKIEDYVGGSVYGKDVSGGLKEGWVSILKINETIAARNTQEKINALIEEFREGKVHVFKGDYVGVDSFDEKDTIDLSEEYIENDKSSAPTFHYVLKDVITIWNPNEKR